MVSRWELTKKFSEIQNRISRNRYKNSTVNKTGIASQYWKDSYYNERFWTTGSPCRRESQTAIPLYVQPKTLDCMALNVRNKKEIFEMNLNYKFNIGVGDYN